jgi:hypothetical protein
MKQLELAMVALKGKIPPTKHKEANIQKAGKYVDNQRMKYKAGKLPLRMQQRLEQLPNWTWNDRKKDFDRQQWEEGLEHLKQSMAKNNNRIPTQTSSKSNRKAHDFAVNEKKKYKNGTLQPDKITALEAIDGWKW